MSNQIFNSIIKDSPSSMFNHFQRHFLGYTCPFSARLLELWPVHSPKLPELHRSHSPKISGVLPSHSPKLTELQLSHSPRLHELYHSIIKNLISHQEVLEKGKIHNSRSFGSGKNVTREVLENEKYWRLQLRKSRRREMPTVS